MGEVVQAEGAFARVRHLAQEVSDIVWRSRIAQAAGVLFGGKRDLYQAFGYLKPGELKAEHLRARYERGDIAGTVVDVWPDATWDDAIEIIENEKPTSKTPFEQDFLSLDERLHVWTYFHRVDKLAQMGEYATLLIGAPGRLDQELPRLSGPDSIAYLQPYGQDSVTIETIEDNPESERFGLPSVYRLKRVTTKKVVNQQLLEDRLIHWSRIVHVADGLLDDNVFSSALRLRRVWNRLDDLDKVAGAGSEAFYRRAHQGTIFNVDKDAQVSDAELKTMQEQIDEFTHDVRRNMKLRATEVQQLGSDVADFSNPVDCLLKLVSSGTRIPKRILEGSERGELASTADQENFDSRVKKRRSQYAEPTIVRQFIDRLVTYGALRAPTLNKGKYIVRWPAPEKTPTESADLALKYATINEKAMAPVITDNEIRDRGLGWEARPELDELTEIKMDDLLNPPEPPPPAPPPDPNAPPPPPEDEDEEDEEEE